MNSTFFVAVSSAAFGAVVTLLIVPRPEPLARSTPLTAGVLRSSFQQALETVLERPQATRVDTVETVSKTPVERRLAAPRARIAPERDPAAAAPPMDVSRVEELRHFRKDALVRRNWIFLSDRDVLRRLGTPTRIYMHVHNGSETWTYTWEGGGSVHLDFRRGELYNVRG